MITTEQALDALDSLNDAAHEADWPTRREHHAALKAFIEQRGEGRVTITKDGAAAVDPDYYWRKIDENTPRGVKLQLLTDTGIALYGKWSPKDTDIVKWAPLPKRRKK